MENPDIPQVLSAYLELDGVLHTSQSFYMFSFSGNRPKSQTLHLISFVLEEWRPFRSNTTIQTTL